MQMASSSSAYLLPGSSSSLGSKSTLIKQTLLPPPLPPPLQSVHHVPHHQVQHSFHRSSPSSHSHQQFLRTTPNSDTFHSLTVTNTNNGNSLLTTNNNNNNNTSVLTNNNGDDSGGSGSGGHSLSQSMESINNIGLTDDEVSENKNGKFYC
jgi:hypothetical protein